MDLLKLAFSITGFTTTLKCRPYTNVKNEKILIALRISIRIKCKIDPRRANRQQVLKTETDTRAESFEKVIKRIGDHIRATIIRRFALLFA